MRAKITTLGGLVSVLLLTHATARAQEDAAMAEVLKPEPGGLTADGVGRRAAETSYQAKASEEALRGAAARVDAAWVAFLPRLSTTFSYTRLSEFTPPSLGVLVGTSAPQGPITSIS